MKHWGRTLGLVALCSVTGISLAEDLGGEITGGKAKKLVDKAKPLLAKAFEIRKKLLFHEDEQSDEYGALAKQCVALFDKGSMFLVDALEIRYDVGVNAMLLRASRDLAKSRAALFQFRNRRAWAERERLKKEREKTKGDSEAPKPDEPEPPKEKEPAPKPAPVREKPPAPTFAPQQPPAVPQNAEPKSKMLGEMIDPAAWARSQRKGIEKRLKDYYGARKKGKLCVRCVLCAGKGKYRDGTECETCHGCGQQINLYYFRKVYWNGFTPVFRAAPGAFDSLTKFLDHARKTPDSMGAEVKTMKVIDIDVHAVWCRARVKVKTKAGEHEDTMTLVSIGSAWYFFNPATDEELIDGR